MAGVLDLFKLDGKVAIVTGGAKGIGLAYAAALAEAGAKVVIADIDSGAVHAETTRLTAAHPGRILGLELDVTSRTSVAAMIGRVERDWGRLDILVNNAAVFSALPTRAKPWEVPLEEWDRVMATNVRGIYDCIDAARPLMAKAGGGKIINISSGTAFHGGATNPHYAASKGAVLTLTRTMARFLGPENIQVNSLVPGFTESSSIVAKHRADGIPLPSEAGRMNAGSTNRIIKRAEVSEDLVGALIFLASPASDFMTGQSIVVDGGNFLH